VELREGEFGGEEYGITSMDPLLVVNGPDRRREAPDRWKDFWLPADFLEPADGSHWGMMLNRRVLDTLVPQMCDWLEGPGNKHAVSNA
jgi:hypothetical protein